MSPAATPLGDFRSESTFPMTGAVCEAVQGQNSSGLRLNLAVCV